MRCRCQVEFGPDGFSGDGAPFDAPAVGEGFDEEQAAAGLGVGGRGLGAREGVTACVGHLDAEGVAAGQECEAEVPAGDAAVGGGVRAEFGGRPVSDPRQLRILELRYGIIRAEALTARESLGFIEHLLGET